ncbi:hypothetical protein HK102_008182, partial [Quaeritorhiza haematococci]
MATEDYDRIFRSCLDLSQTDETLQQNRLATFKLSKVGSISPSDEIVGRLSKVFDQFCSELFPTVDDAVDQGQSRGDEQSEVQVQGVRVLDALMFMKNWPIGG